MSNGTVKRTYGDKGFGFIREDGGQNDYFFHRSAVLPPGVFDEIVEGDKVSFDPGEGQKGPRAANVVLL